MSFPDGKPFCDCGLDSGFADKVGNADEGAGGGAEGVGERKFANVFVAEEAVADTAGAEKVDEKAETGGVTAGAGDEVNAKGLLAACASTFGFAAGDALNENGVELDAEDPKPANPPSFGVPADCIVCD